MDGYLAKPFTIEGLSSQLSSACENKTENPKPDAKPASISDAKMDGSFHSNQNSGTEQIDVDNSIITGTSHQHSDDTDFNDTEFNDIELISETTLEFIHSIGSSSSINMSDKIFGLYIEHATSAINAVRQAATEGTSHQLAQSSHALKSMSLSAGATAVAEICQKIEDNAKSGEFHNYHDNNGDLKILANVFAATIREMKTHIRPVEAEKIAN